MSHAGFKPEEDSTGASHQQLKTTDPSSRHKWPPHRQTHNRPKNNYIKENNFSRNPDGCVVSRTRTECSCWPSQVQWCFGRDEELDVVTRAHTHRMSALTSRGPVDALDRIKSVVVSVAWDGMKSVAVSAGRWVAGASWWPWSDTSAVAVSWVAGWPRVVA
jgi:hypothetical protein